jgi:catechol 2,3-dioxygenase-like lactoylglutathione lyase family enzyme
VIQLQPENSWSLLEKTASLVSIPAKREPLLRPTGINHMLLAVSNTARSTAFYEKILGRARVQPARPVDNLSERINFRAGKHQLALAPLNQGIHKSGQIPGVDHFGIIAEFDQEKLKEQLRESGATVLPPIEDGRGVDFLDPDGVRTQVHNPPKPRV